MLEKAHRGHCEVMPVTGFMSGCTFSASPDASPPPDSATMPKLVMPTARMQPMTSITTPYGTALSARRKSCLFRAVECLTKEQAAYALRHYDARTRDGLRHRRKGDRQDQGDGGSHPHRRPDVRAQSMNL